MGVPVKVKGHGSKSWVKVKGPDKISGAQRSILGARLCRVQQGEYRKFGAKESHYQSKVFLCVYDQWAYADNCAYAVDRQFL